MRMRKVCCLLLLAVVPLALFGQSVSTTFGGSQLLDMAGLQANYTFGDKYGWTGIGYDRNGFQLSGYLNVPLRIGYPTKSNLNRYRLGVGDHELNAWITTDEYKLDRVAVRGASLYRHTKTSDIQGFVGTYTSEEWQPYLHASSDVGSNFTGAIVGHFVLRDGWELQSFNTVGKSISSIQSLNWEPSRRWRFSSATGIGSNHPFSANAVEYRRGELNLRASFTSASDQFHRRDGSYDIEPLGFNGKAEIPLGRNTVARFSHRHELMVVPDYLGYQQKSSVGTTDTAGITTGFFGFRASGSMNQSSSNAYPGKNQSETFSVSRKIVPRWQTTFSYLHSSMRLQEIAVQQSTNEFRINNHLYLSHNLARINGSVSNTFGARWSSNLVSFSVDNQVYTSPVAAQFGQKSVFQAWTFSIRFRTPHGTTAHVDTTVDPNGKMQWGGYLSGLQYQRLNGNGQEESYVTFSKHVISGKVVNEAGKGVWGIAVKVGPDLVYSDTEGQFFIHVKNSRPLPLLILAEASLQPATWKLESAPGTVRGVPSGDASSPVIIVVQMKKTTMSAAAR